MGEPPLRVGPPLPSQFAEDLILRLGPERPRDLQDSCPFGCEPHRLDAPIRVRAALDQTIALQKVEAARQRRLVDGERVLELLQVRLTHAPDGRENAELSHPDTARPQHVVVELGDGASDHAKGVADAGRYASRANRPPDASPTHGRHRTSLGRAGSSTSYVDTS